MNSQTILFLDFEGVFLDQQTLVGKGLYLDLRNFRSAKYMCDLNTFKELKRLIVKKPLLTFLGYSSYHHFTYLLLTLIEDSFDLVVLDHHRDEFHKDFIFLACDSWVRVARKLRNVCKVFFVSEQRDLPKVVCHPIYLSIDKDILSPRYLITGFEQGDFSPNSLLGLVTDICKRYKIIGVDICGEPIYPFQVRTSEQINLALLETILFHVS